MQPANYIRLTDTNDEDIIVNRLLIRTIKQIDDIETCEIVFDEKHTVRVQGSLKGTAGALRVIEF